MTVKRGEIYLISIPGQEKPRPAIVLTANWLNRYALDISVVPITSVPRKAFPTRVSLRAGDAGLRMDSWAKCDQVTTIPKELLKGSPFGRLNAAAMQAIDAAVRLALGL